MRRQLGVVISVLMLSTACHSQQFEKTDPSLESIENSLRHGDPRAALEKFFSCEKHAGSAYEAIASGAQEWVSLAEKMLNYSDACYTEGIQASLGRAMQKTPQHVLPLVGKTPVLAAEYICLPFISNEIPKNLQLAEVVRSKNVIHAVSDGRIESQKNQCLRFIERVEASLRDQ